MTKMKKIIALLLVICLTVAIGAVSVSAATVDENAAVAADYNGVKVHVYSE